MPVSPICSSTRKCILRLSKKTVIAFLARQFSFLVKVVAGRFLRVGWGCFPSSLFGGGVKTQTNYNGNQPPIIDILFFSIYYLVAEKSIHLRIVFG